MAENIEHKSKLKCELFNDSFQNFRKYAIPKAQLVIADVPYNVADMFYGSNPSWYIGGDNKNGESKLAHKQAFYSDNNFNIAEYFNFCSHLLKKEPKKGSEIRGRSSDAPCMIVFCSFQQQELVIKYGKKYGFPNYIPLTFVKNYSAQALKANMRVVGATEHAILLYRGRLPKFRNNGKMVYDWFLITKEGDKKYPRIHPTQKSVTLLKTLIQTFTDPGDVVIDPCAGSCSTLRAAKELGRNSYGFEISKDFCKKARELMIPDTIFPEDKVTGQTNLIDLFGEEALEP